MRTLMHEHCEIFRRIDDELLHPDKRKMFVTAGQTFCGMQHVCNVGSIIRGKYTPAFFLIAYDQQDC